MTGLTHVIKGHRDVTSGDQRNKKTEEPWMLTRSFSVSFPLIIYLI